MPDGVTEAQSRRRAMEAERERQDIADAQRAARRGLVVPLAEIEAWVDSWDTADERTLPLAPGEQAA